MTPPLSDDVMIAWLGMAALVLSAPRPTRPERCTTLLECGSCPEISAQAQRKSPQGQDVTFCDPVGEEVTWHNERTRAQGERFGGNARGAGAIGIKAACSSPTATTPTPARPMASNNWHPKRRKTAHYDEGILDGSYTTWHATGHAPSKGPTRRSRSMRSAMAPTVACSAWH